VREESIEELLARRLFEQRVVQLRGPVDDLTAGRAAAELMTLDADGDTAVTLRIDSADGSLGAALTLMDVVELLGVPVNALCLGQVAGPAIGVLAVCRHRSAMPSTRLYLNEPRTQTELHVRNMAQWAEVRTEERRRFCERIATAVGQSADAIAEDLRTGRFFSAEEAISYGLLDEICRPEAEIHQLPGPPMGFRPRR